MISDLNEFIKHLKSECGFIPADNAIDKMFSNYRENYVFKMPLYDEASNLYEENSPEKKALKWQGLHRDSINDCERSLIKLAYHCDNILSMHSRVLSFHNLGKLNLSDIRSSLCIGSGNYRRMDFEYHGFLDSERQTLNYLSVAISTLNKCEGNRFRKLEQNMKKRYRKEDIPEWLKNIFLLMRGYEEKFPLLRVRTDINKSPRDRINHGKYVSSGDWIINSEGLKFFNREIGEDFFEFIRNHFQYFYAFINNCLSNMGTGTDNFKI